MKTKTFFFLPLFLFSLWSCEQEENEPVEEISLSAIVMPAYFSAHEHQEIIVQITTGTPCYTIDIKKTVSGNTFIYDFRLIEDDIACVQVVKKHDIPVVFDPPSAGTYTLRFLIDGEFYEKREVVVTENILVGTWQVISFENELENTAISSPEDEEISILIGSSGFEGTTERNSFEGEYQVHDKHKIHITKFLSTEQEETEFGKRFYDVMRIWQIQPLPFEAKENLIRINYEEGQFMVLSRLK